MAAEALSALDRRNRDRMAVDVLVSCRVPAVPVAARLVDLSKSGCKLRFSKYPPEVGSSVTVALEAGPPVVGEVVWQTIAEAGVRFRRTLSTSQCVHYGLEAPVAPEPVEVVEPSKGLISHWMHAIARKFAR